jgi:hypothetical protein
MSVMETRLPRRRAAARNANDKGKKLLLAGLAVVLVALLAFELPKFLKSSSSSSTTASTPVTTTPAAAATGSAPLVTPTGASAAHLRAIHRMPVRNPFVPLLHESASTSDSSAPAPAPASTPAPAAAPPTPAPVAPAPAVDFTPSAVTPAPPVSTTPKVTTPEVTNPVHVKPAPPSAAVIWTNGRRQVVGLSQEFKIGQVRFRLIGVTPKVVRIRIVGGAFAGGKQTITARRGHRVKLTNTATGVEYGLLFGAASAEAGQSS